MNNQNLTRKGKGRPKGAKNKCTQVKDQFYEAWFKLGALKGFLEIFQDKKVCTACGTIYPPDYDGKHCKCAGLLRFISGDSVKQKYYLGAIPAILPKKTEIEGKGITVVLLKAEDIHKDPKSGLGEDA